MSLCHCLPALLLLLDWDMDDPETSLAFNGITSCGADGSEFSSEDLRYEAVVVCFEVRNSRKSDEDADAVRFCRAEGGNPRPDTPQGLHQDCCNGDDHRSSGRDSTAEETDNSRLREPIKAAETRWPL